MFEGFYGSVWQQPVLLVLVPLASLFLLPRRRDFLSLYLWVFTLETLLDALLTSSLFALPSFVSLGFVLLGDARVFTLTEWARLPSSGQAPSRYAGLGRAALLTLPVPVAQALLVAAFPATFAEPRHTYLAYECLFLVWLGAYGLWLMKQELRASSRRFLQRLCLYSLSYYALWALADVWILSGADAGYLLRVVPNLLYYSLFLPLVLRLAPAELR